MATDTPMQLGMVGLGRMGAGIVRRLLEDGHHCVGYDIHPDAVEAVVADVQAGNPVGRDYTEYSFMKYGGSELIFVPEEVPAEAVEAMQAREAEIKAAEAKGYVEG